MLNFLYTWLTGWLYKWLTSLFDFEFISVGFKPWALNWCLLLVNVFLVLTLLECFSSLWHIVVKGLAWLEIQCRLYGAWLVNDLWMTCEWLDSRPRGEYKLLVSRYKFLELYLPGIACHCVSSCIIIIESVRSTMCEEPLENHLWWVRLPLWTQNR